MATPWHNNPCPGGCDIYNFSRPYLGYHYYILRFSDLCLGVEKKIYITILKVKLYFGHQDSREWKAVLTS